MVPGGEDCESVAVVDPRTSELGVRLVCPRGGFESQLGVRLYKGQRRYDLMRNILGIAEGVELDGVLPLNYHSHLLNGVSFRKGCYVGQELT